MESGGARRASTSSTAPSINRPISPMSTTETDPHPFNDDNVTEYAESIRPASEVHDDPFRDPSASSTSLPDNPFEPPKSSRSRRSLQQRQSIRKSYGIRHDRSPSDHDRLTTTANHYASHLNRSPSIASSISFACTHSPSASEHGPSHPYGMFDQGFTPSRSASFAASSIQRTASTRSTRSRQGPAHPYNLYPQDVSSIGTVPQDQIPVGFPGHAHNFRRRIGADGEEQDIIDSDGHAEQLPPYSRYPDDTTGKTLAFGPMPQIGEATGSHDQLVRAAEPAEDPVEEADSPILQPPEPTPTPPSDDGSTTWAMSEKTTSHKSWKEKSWKEKSITRVCCGVVPLWSIMLSVIVITLLVVILGVFLGAIDQQEDTKYKDPDAEVEPAHYSPSPSPTATYYDAAPTATPNLPSLPTGTFIVPLGIPDVLYNACLGDDQLNAWTCDLTAAQTLCVTINQQNGTDRAFLSTCNNYSKVGYGTQPPFIVQQTLKLVTDLDNTTLGPAWHFQTFYDKLVVLPAIQLQQTAAKQKREAQQSWNWPFFATPAYSQTYEQYGGPVRVNDQAWFCHWDDTFIEGFIYATVSNPMPTTTTSNATSTAAYFFTSSTTTEATPVLQYYEPSPSSYRSYEAIKPRNDGDHDSDDYSTTTSSPSSGTPTPASSIQFSTTKSNHNSSSTAPPPPPPTPTCIPQLVKFEERRLKGLHDSAMCNLMLKMPDYTFLPVNDTYGMPVIVTLVEDDGPNGVSKRLKRSPLYTTGGGAALERRQSRYVASEVEETCFCQWTSEQFEI